MSYKAAVLNYDPGARLYHTGDGGYYVTLSRDALVPRYSGFREAARAWEDAYARITERPNAWEAEKARVLAKYPRARINETGLGEYRVERLGDLLATITFTGWHATEADAWAEAARTWLAAPTAWEAEKARVLAAFPNAYAFEGERGCKYRIERHGKDSMINHTLWHTTEAGAWVEAARTWLTPSDEQYVKSLYPESTLHKRASSRWSVELLPPRNGREPRAVHVSHGTEAEAWAEAAKTVRALASSDEQYVKSVYPDAWCDPGLAPHVYCIWNSPWRSAPGSGSSTQLANGGTPDEAWAKAAEAIRSRPHATDEQYVKSVYPDAGCVAYLKHHDLPLVCSVRRPEHAEIAPGAMHRIHILGEGPTIAAAWAEAARTVRTLTNGPPGNPTGLTDADVVRIAIRWPMTNPSIRKALKTLVDCLPLKGDRDV